MISVDFSEFHAVIGGMTRRASNTAPIMQDVADMLAKQADRQFDVGGPGWTRLATSTIAQKGHAAILVDSGAMRKSIKGTSGSDYAMVTIDSPAGFHQDGGPRLPARDPLSFFSRESVDGASALIVDWIIG